MSARSAFAEDYDGFSSTPSATFINGGVKYKGELTIDVFVAIYA